MILIGMHAVEGGDIMEFVNLLPTTKIPSKLEVAPPLSKMWTGLDGGVDTP